jgi:type III secretion protein Q
MQAAESFVDLGSSTLLPRLDPLLVRAFNRLYNHRAAPLAVPIGGASYVLNWVFEERPQPPLDAFRFKVGPHAGWLGLDVPALAALLGESRPLRVPRPLRCVLVANALSSCVDSLIRATRLHFEWLPNDVADPAVHVSFDACTTVRFHLVGTCWSGALAFDMPADLDALAPSCMRTSAHDNAAVDNLRLPLRFAIGTTRIRMEELLGIAHGDLVAIEEWRSAGAAVVVSSVLRGPAGRGFIALAEGSRITIQQFREQSMNHPAEASPACEPRATTDLALERLDALEVTLRFEVGDLSVSLGELRNLRPGHVFELGQPLNRGPVRILADGNLLGKGTLVAVGDRLGVRVSEFASGAL